MSTHSSLSKIAAGATLAVALTSVLSGCGSSSSSSTSGPIKIGSVSGITGSAVFPEASRAARAVFDRVNKEGGIDGRKISYIAEDDKGDPAVAAQAARKLVDDEKVVSLAGSASALECAVNQAYYKQRKVLSVQGLGVDPACFSSPQIAPVNPGPFAATTAALTYASDTLKDTKVCAFMNTFAGWGPAEDAAVKAWEKHSGQKITYYKRDIQPADDLTPYVIATKKAGCDAVYALGLDFQAIATMKAVQQQGAQDIDWLFTSAAYTDQVAKALGAAGENMYAFAEFEPFTGAQTTGAAKDFSDLMTSSKIPLTAFAQAGYLSATVTVQALKSIKGDINRESVSAALEKLDVKSDLIGAPYVFNRTKNPDAANRTGKIVQLKAGQWVTVTPDWITAP